MALAIVGTASVTTPASADAAKIECFGGENCLYRNDTLVDFSWPIPGGQCHATAVYDMLGNNTSITQRMWENDNCTGSLADVPPGHLRWTSTLRRSVGGT
ncbi:hypothetical protein [Amycolatopsis sp. NPDC059657]|uniref:hypothetical protein n=1 Tax=Amycolatopsis sp. NPDC059657 TaxID=3346899 RepID=UPI00366E12B5